MGENSVGQRISFQSNLVVFTRHQFRDRVRWAQVHDRLSFAVDVMTCRPMYAEQRSADLR